MTYEEALAYIHSTQKFGSKPGLMRIRALLDRLGNPEQRVRYIHIAGTNGKGSTTAMSAAVLRAAGYRVGMFISPFIHDFRERIQINGEMIPKDALAGQLEQLIPHIEAVKDMGFAEPSEFEIITALALCYFAEKKCDVGVLEVGLGGRFDTTNAIPPPVAAVITSISLDHTKVLGGTVAAIAYEKAGIIKENSAAVCYADQPSAALEVIRARCTACGVPLVMPDHRRLTVHSSGLEGSSFTYDGLELTVPMPGRHQIENALTVVETMRTAAQRGLSIAGQHIVQGIGETRFAGRLEIIRRDPLCIVDGGHNPGAMQVLGQAIDDYLPGRRLIVVMAMFADKDYKNCIPEVARRSTILIGTQSAYHRALPARAVADAASAYCAQVYAYDNVTEAVRFALSIAGPQDAVLSCGSLYTIDEARRAFLSH